MPKEPEERYLEWLTREEERVGLSATLRATEDIEYARVLLYDELGYEPTESQLSTFMGSGAVRFEQLPTLGVSYKMEEHWWGFQSTYRDVVTGRYVKVTDVYSALRTFFP